MPIVSSSRFSPEDGIQDQFFQQFSDSVTYLKKKIVKLLSNFRKEDNNKV